MENSKYVAYLRVSTAKQGHAGLGIEAQRSAVATYLCGRDKRDQLLREFVEVESGSNNLRPELARAMTTCRLHNATLLIAKLDRLSRDAHFLLGLQKGSVRFVAADMPEANELFVGIMAVVAQAERRMISDRTKAALAAAKARGVKLGGLRYRNDGSYYVASDAARASGIATGKAKADARACDVYPIIEDIRARGIASLSGIADALNARGIPSARGKSWSASTIRRAIMRSTNAVS